MVAPKLRRRGSWLGIPDAIRNAFSDAETNTADAIDQLSRWAKPVWTYVEVQANHLASPWELVVATAACKILLPVPSAQTIGTEVCVVRNTADTVTVWPISGQIDGGTYSTPTANMASRYVCTKQGWHSNG